MNLGTMSILLPSIALLLATVFIAPSATALAADDPFKNKISIETDEGIKTHVMNRTVEITTPIV